MNLQFISDDSDKTTNGYTPTGEINIPEWHINIVRQRVSDYKKNLDQILDFDTATNDIDNIL